MASVNLVPELEDGGELPRSRAVALCELLGFSPKQVDRIVFDSDDVPMVRVRLVGADFERVNAEALARLAIPEDASRLEADADGVTVFRLDGRRVRYTWDDPVEEREG